MQNDISYEATFALLKNKSAWFYADQLREQSTEQSNLLLKEIVRRWPEGKFLHWS